MREDCIIYVSDIIRIIWRCSDRDKLWHLGRKCISISPKSNSLVYIIFHLAIPIRILINFILCLVCTIIAFSQVRTICHHRFTNKVISDDGAWAEKPCMLQLQNSLHFRDNKYRSIEIKFWNWPTGATMARYVLSAAKS